MPLQHNPHTMALRRTSPASARDNGGFSGRVCRRVYFVSALLLLYCAFASLYIEQGFTRSLSEPTMIRRPKDYPMELDRPKIKKYRDAPSGDGASAVDATAKSVTHNDAPKPRLFLHVGPQKTGSSTLQSTLDKLSGLTGHLEGDNFVYKHIMPEQGDFDCDLDAWGGWHDCTASESLQTLIRTTREAGQNLLLTDENLDANFAQGLRDAIDDADWDVTVIVMYRRIHEWLVSWYNQIHKTTNLDRDGTVLFDSNGIPYRTQHKHWPGTGGVRVPSFRSWFEEYTRNQKDLVHFHRSIQYYELYKEFFDNVVHYDMHREGSSMVNDFVCDILGAAHACDKLQHHAVPIESINGSVHLEHDILAVAAYERGLLPPEVKLSRKDVVEEVARFVQTSGRTIPRKCHAGMIDRIRNWLVDTERILVGEDRWSSDSKDALLESYESFVAGGAMCDVDMESVLADENWLRLFRSIGKYEERNLVLHVGPVGGNAIRDALTTLSGKSMALKHDNYTLLDVDVARGGYFECHPPNQCEASQKLKSALWALEGTGKNLLISSDDLDERFVGAFREAIDARKWNVKVVVGYIRLHELLLLMYEREYFHEEEHSDEKGPLWIPLKESPDHEEHSKWPDEGGTSIPTFNAWFRAFAEDSEAAAFEQLGMHLRNSYVSSFENVDFSAYHPRGTNMVTNFACQVLPNAPHTCEAAKALQPADKSPSMNQQALSDQFAEADILAVRAREKGLVGKDATRTALRASILHRLRSTPTKVLARICVSGVTKQLYDWMIESEKATIGDRFNPKRIAGINEDFQQLLESGKLCALDVEKELADGYWTGIFREHRVGLPTNQQ